MRLPLPLLALALAAAAPAVENVAVNGDFSAKDFTGWTLHGDPKQLSIASEQGNRFLRVDTSAKKSDGGLFQEIELRPDWSSVKVSVRIRVSQMAAPAAGDAIYNRPIFHYLTIDAAGKPIATATGGESVWSKFMVDGDSAWKTWTADKEIPAGAQRLKLECRILGAQAIADYDDVVITPVLKRP